MPRLTVLALSSLAAVTGALLISNQMWGSTAPDVDLESTVPPASASPLEADGSAGSATPPSTAAPDRSGIPVQVVIPFSSSNHPGGVTAPVTADPLLPNGDLFVPEDPGTVSWAAQDARPGADRGTAILVGHVNNAGVVGALSDLAEYASQDVGSTFTVVLADGRQLLYQVSGGAAYDKDQLADDPDLRREIYDQENAFGTGTGRLVLVSCGGAFDNSTGNYEDNVFLFAMPVA
jgi:hypothetical protein